jgi:hypothetical protein
MRSDLLFDLLAFKLREAHYPAPDLRLVRAKLRQHNPPHSGFGYLRRAIDQYQLGRPLNVRGAINDNDSALVIFAVAE